ncbi:MAG: hypothetical protein R3B57_14360 [Phycisphaerales bacterium]
MRIRRSGSLSLLALVAIPWGAALVIGGLWILEVGGPWLGLSPAQRGAGGVAGLAAGSLVFTYCLADRLFPLASRRVVWAAEIFTCSSLLIGLGVLVACWALGSPPPLP